MRLLSLLFSGFCAAALGAADAPLIKINPPRSEPQVEETGRFLAIAAPNTNNKINTPPGALAAAAAVNDTFFEWSPSQSGGVTGGADICGVLLSPDETLLLLFERVGGADRNNSTRVVCFNLGNNRIVRGFTLKPRRVTPSGFVPGSRLIVAAEDAQPQIDRPGRIILIDPVEGSVQAESAPFPGKIAHTAAGESRLFATVENENAVYSMAIDKLAEAPQKVISKIPGGKLKISPDGRKIINFGNGRMEVFDATTPVPELLASHELPLNPSGAFAVDEQAESIVFMENGGKACLLGGGTTRELSGGKFTGIGCRLGTGEKFLTGVEQNNSLALFVPPVVEAEKIVAPGSLKPRNRNRNLAVFGLTGSDPEAILVDHRANISRLKIMPRRWQKDELFTPAAP